MKQATVTIQINIVRARWDDRRDTGLMGYLDATYAEIVEAIGDPMRFEEKGLKSDAEWVIVAEGQPDMVLTIYNYKDGRNYLGHQGLDVEAITKWHLGGRGAPSLAIACALFGDRVTST